ncbi:hypothetical protein [Bradyrhizobium monzae]|uniref:hypothetical protein n=1 Tax=Bradyrhizobium sp. Oc8 TaxID=2876780 RepID=UPI001F47CE37|nr:hypothetical protein [Bradyrhizobium sp. Oc8]
MVLDHGVSALLGRGDGVQDPAGRNLREAKQSLRCGLHGRTQNEFIHGEIVARDGVLVFSEPSGAVLKLPKSREAAYAGSVGQPVVLRRAA